MEQEFSEFRESNKSLKHELESIERSCISLAVAVVVSWSLMQEMPVLSPFTVMTNISGTEFSENI